ncbi:MAG: hypothetical protein ACD_25C00088G0003 [uncultured bacterium]|uniref:Uncharacterized protein n=3 Tax=Katanobacteria TaxID=422282 RepID=A0A1F4W2P1_UNCKA|nr:MAG: hypothetical protein ACD_25C00088G0003 [uncultured bacterium]KKS03378.1 MAG: hypothetical protein UU55_C0003G0092 [candidate division WWE3 bacterium GW2011_GWC2_41_23]KKS10552.1 MAG: hypothetical protein UU64_C0003G0061 [candidate division WWE3 bacterium GW2011_GWF2_41_45]KKS20253.1 MAG: hypothetical protein UU79_C0002G0019 [candidate division WWE3 bacterium GW2011_GWE1_41_72]KKS28217.1 MAG: hypothetical protein UU90_C0033G0002 [candidate division WWE3 bacterium GW2011_GWD2_42_11]KKS28
MNVRLAVVDKGKPRLWGNGKLEKTVLKLTERYYLKCGYMLNGDDVVMITDQNNKKHMLKVRFERVDYSEKEFLCTHEVVKAYPILSIS